ncbi:hypothetical protein WS76_29240 [Burkholderia humptydooensis]|nr:hypothetical protein WS76_29240 [Burkholderia humptydooensis]
MRTRESWFGDEIDGSIAKSCARRASLALRGLPPAACAAYGDASTPAVHSEARAMNRRRFAFAMSSRRV